MPHLTLILVQVLNQSLVPVKGVPIRPSLIRTQLHIILLHLFFIHICLIHTVILFEIVLLIIIARHDEYILSMYIINKNSIFVSPEEDTELTDKQKQFVSSYPF